MNSQIELSMAGEQCTVCGAEDWGVTEESQIFCKTCNCVIERVVESEDPIAHFDPTARVVTLGRGSKGKKLFKQSTGGCLWSICEGIQFVLQLQADALISLGICSQIKNDVLCSLWRKYLQKTNQAFTLQAMSTASCVSDDGASEVGCAGSGAHSATSSLSWLSGWTDVSMVTKNSETDASSVNKRHVGSVDGALFRFSRLDVPHMSLTLSLCYISLLWINSPLTLLDLLRLAWEGSVPYLHIVDKFPDEIKFSKQDTSIFEVTRVPSHGELLWEVNKLAVFLALPEFPVPSPQSLAYPPCLAARFLRELNLPDGLLKWCCMMVEPAIKHVKPQARCLPQHELHAASAVVLSLGWLYGLDDETEWEISAREAKESAKTVEPVFVFEEWYQVEAAKLRIEKSAERKEQRWPRQTTTSERPIFYSDKTSHYAAMKYRRLVKNLQSQFLQLKDHSSSSPGHSQDELAKSEYGREEVCFHGHTLLVSPSWGGPKAWARSFPPPCFKMHRKQVKKRVYSEMSHILSYSMQHLLSLLHQRLGPSTGQLHRAIWQLEGAFVVQ